MLDGVHQFRDVRQLSCPGSVPAEKQAGLSEHANFARSSRCIRGGACIGYAAVSPVTGPGPLRITGVHDREALHGGRGWSVPAFWSQRWFTDTAARHFGPGQHRGREPQDPADCPITRQVRFSRSTGVLPWDAHGNGDGSFPDQEIPGEDRCTRLLSVPGNGFCKVRSAINVFTFSPSRPMKAESHIHTSRETTPPRVPNVLL